MDYISPKVRAHWCNKEFNACTTTSQIKRARKGFLVQGFCKTCGRLAWFATRNLSVTKTCGCRNGSGVALTDEILVERFKTRNLGKVIANLKIVDVLSRVKKDYVLICKDVNTNEEREMLYSRWFARKYLKGSDHEWVERRNEESKKRIERLYSKKRWDLERIWFDVVKAGRTATGE